MVVHNEGGIAFDPNDFLVDLLGVVVEEPLVVLAPSVGGDPTYRSTNKLTSQRRDPDDRCTGYPPHPIISGNCPCQ